MKTNPKKNYPIIPLQSDNRDSVKYCDCDRNESSAKENLARKSSPGFDPDPEFWTGFQRKIICDCNVPENFSERLSRWRTAYLPCPIIQYSNGGLFRMLLLGVLAVVAILLLLGTPLHSHAPQTPDSFRIEHDSTGLPIYQAVDLK